MKYIILMFLFFYLLISMKLTEYTAWTEMLVYPYLLNHGFVVYKDLIAPYTPFLLWFLQVVENVFGYGPQVVFTLTLILAVINTSLVFFIAQRLSKNLLAGLLSGGFYVLWFLYFEGNGLWFELFQTPFILLGFYYLYLFLFGVKETKYILRSGVFLGISFFIKQSAIWLLLIGVAFIFARQKSFGQKISSIVAFLLPSLVLFLITTLVAFGGGYLQDYWNWAFVYTFLQFPFSVGHSQYPSLNNLLKLSVPLLIILPLIFSVLRRDMKAVFLLIFITGSFLAAVPRWGLFHLQPFLALISLVAVPQWVEWLKDRRPWKVLISLVLIMLWVIVVGKQIGRFWQRPTRFFEPSVSKVAVSLQQKGYQNYYVFNSWDQLYPLTGSVPIVKPYVQNFAWFMEIPGMQERVIEALWWTQPEFIVFSGFAQPEGFEIGHYKPHKLAEYVEKNYVMKEKLSEDVWLLERK